MCRTHTIPQLHPTAYLHSPHLASCHTPIILHSFFVLFELAAAVSFLLLANSRQPRVCVFVLYQVMVSQCQALAPQHASRHRGCPHPLPKASQRWGAPGRGASASLTARNALAETTVHELLLHK
uniref:Uncharacterized protein n=1 Tax=Buteo japonicus TaxID=224669 RepID=A0A8C0HMM9_9AVES